MKKRVAAAVLALAIVASVVAVISIPSYAATMGKTQSKLVGELTDFIKTAETQVPRDDYQNLPEGMQTKHPLTVELEEKIAQAKEVRSRKDVDEMDAFLVELYGGWVEIVDEDGNGTGEYGYGDANKPYTAFQDTLNIRWGGGNYSKGNYTGLEYALYFSDRPFSQLKREDYTIESWEVLRAAIEKIEDYVEVTEEYPLSHLAVATRSEMYYNLQDYYAAYDKLVPFTGDKEVNKYRGYLYDVLYRTYQEPYMSNGWEFDEIYATMDVTKEEDCPEYTTLRTFVDGAYAAYENPAATLDEIKYFLDTEPRYTVKTETSSYLISKTDAEKQIAEGTLKEEDIVKVLDDNGDPTSEYAETYMYSEKMSGYVQNFRAAIYVGKNYRDDKDAVYNKALLEYQNGLYADEDWNVFMKCFEAGDAIVALYTAKESQFIAAIEGVYAAYEILQATVEGDVTQYERAYNQIKEWMEKTDMTVYTSDSVQLLETAITTSEAAYAQFNEGSARVTEEDLYTYVLYIYNAKDALKIADTGTENEDVGLEEVLNQMVVLLDEFAFMRDEFLAMFDGAEISDIQQECLDMFVEAYDAFEKLVNKGLDEVEANKADANSKITVTTAALFESLLELYQTQNTLTLQIAAPGTSND